MTPHPEKCQTIRRGRGMQSPCINYLAVGGEMSRLSAQHHVYKWLKEPDSYSIGLEEKELRLGPQLMQK